MRRWHRASRPPRRSPRASSPRPTGPDADRSLRSARAPPLTQEVVPVATAPQPQPDSHSQRVGAWLETAREFFWVLALGVIAGYAFFLALGALSAQDALPISRVVAGLSVLRPGSR